MRPAVILFVVMCAAGAVISVGAAVWNARPSDGANIGAALLEIFGLAVLATGGLGVLVCLIAVVVLRVERR